MFPQDVSLNDENQRINGTAADYGHGNRAGAAISGHGRMGSFTKRAVSFAKSLFYISLT